MYENPRLILDSDSPPEPGHFLWRSPSNIAVIKYWGKYGEQMPRNPSLSLTLSAAFTDMKMEYAFREGIIDDEIDLGFYFHEQENEAFAAKIKEFLKRLLPVFPFLKQLKFTIRSGNSFPHSAGIASSASSMSALALCLCALEDRLFGTLSDAAEFDRKASYVARLGSGSACRSIFPWASVWGKTDLIPGSSDEYAVPIGDLLHERFRDFHDDVLIISADEKSVSSRDGHALMEGNPYASARYDQARERLAVLLDALRSGDLNTFGQIAEAEALTLHALMMCSNPPYILMKPNTLAAIERVRAYREATGNPLYFTLDAGPNLHLLYPGEIVHEVREFIGRELADLCENEYILEDWIGEGPEEF